MLINNEKFNRIEKNDKKMEKTITENDFIGVNSSIDS
jgi:hypothetical protein